MKDDRQDMFDSTDALVDFIDQVTETEEYNKEEQALVAGPHPPAEVLYDISIGLKPDVDAKDLGRWQKHVSLCPVCSEQSFDIRKVHRGLLGISHESPVSDWKDVIRSIGERIGSIKVSIVSLAERATLITQVAPVPEGAGDSFEWDRPPYKCLTREWVEAGEFFAGELMTLRLQTPSDGYVVAFMFDESQTPGLAYPSSGKDDTLIRAKTAKDLQCRAPELPGDYRIAVVWSESNLLNPVSINYSRLDTDPALCAFAEIIDSDELNHDEVGLDIHRFIVTSPPPPPPIQPPTHRILAVRTKPGADYIVSHKWDYWRPHIFDELRKGRARYAWSYSDEANLFELQKKIKSSIPLDSREMNMWKHAGFLWDLEPGDYLFYVNVPTDDTVTVVELTDGYDFTGVWDPQKVGDHRHVIQCEYKGVFRRDAFHLGPLSVRLKLRPSHWTLEPAWPNVAELLQLLEP
ncbi:MAG: hypothetical protein WBG50_24605 [Desulfomonilaceae bacterium]